MAFDDLEPVQAPDDIRFAHLMAVVAQIAGNQKARIIDFLPAYLRQPMLDDEESNETAAEMHAQAVRDKFMAFVGRHATQVQGPREATSE